MDELIPPVDLMARSNPQLPTRVELITYLQSRKDALKKRLEQVPEVGHHYDTMLLTAKYEENDLLLKMVKGENEIQ